MAVFIVNQKKPIFVLSASAALRKAPNLQYIPAKKGSGYKLVKNISLNLTYGRPIEAIGSQA